MKPLVLGLILAAGPVAAETRYICWQGANGYAMTGSFSFPDNLTGGLVTEADLTDFRIKGWLDGQPIGAWDMREATPFTSWMLRYDAGRDEFRLGDTDTGLYQMWNAGGSADDCGTPGFGFNAGNNAQDLCLNDTWVVDSMVDPMRPILGRPRPGSPSDCDGVQITSKDR